MRNKRLCPASMIVIMAATVATPALAAGFGGAGRAALLGQPLDFVAQLRLDAGEILAPECVHAEVAFGERRLPAAQVHVRIEAQVADSARIRVLTTPAVDEPVLGITLGVGCQTRLSRHYVVLADPPQPAIATAAVVTAPAFARAPASAELLAVSMPAAAAPGAAGSPSGTENAAAGGAAWAAVLETAPASAPAPASEPLPEPAPRTAARTTPSAAPRAVARPERRSQRSSSSRTRAPVPKAPRLVAVAPSAPRLRLDFVEATPGAEAAAVETALQAVAQAASAAQASAAAASAAAARIATLERTVGRLASDAATVRDEAAQLRRQLARADDASRWIWPLLVGGLLLAALAGWLAWRLSSLQRERQPGWLAAMSQPPPDGGIADATAGRQATAPVPFVTSEVHLPAALAAPSRSDIGAARGHGRPTALDADAATARDVSIEELIDLEQQAEFFVVLGQDDAAIDLLMQHLRDTGGGSPLPYLKLLELHHRRGDRLAYERTRESFNHRFNAYAPAWEVDLGAGRSLEDYPGVVPRLQQVWPRPLDAMAELEALLFRKSRGELFDLPAYREVLFLYALARDLLDREAVDPEKVDLLLPLADGSEYGTTAPTPLIDLGNGRGAAGAGAVDRARAAVDLDLTQAAPPSSIFDPLVSTAQRPRA